MNKEKINHYTAKLLISLTNIIDFTDKTRLQVLEIIKDNKVVTSGLALFAFSELQSENIDKVYDNTKNGISSVLNIQTQNKQQIISEIFDDIVLEFGHDDIYNPDFQERLYDTIRAYEDFSGTKLLQALLLGFLYGFAYLRTVGRIKNDYMPIDVKTFTTFALTSGGMVLVNGATPGSIVYLESFLLAGYAVFLHLKNQKEGKKMKGQSLDMFFDEAPYPIVHYNKDGLPILWNKKMEEETGYTLEDIQEYYKENGDIMTLLYTGEDLDKVNQYLNIIKETGEGYKHIAFTLTTKSGEKKTYLWTTMPDGEGGTIRTAQHITNEAEIKKELEETKRQLRNDSLTGSLNRYALEIDLSNIINNKNRITDKNNYIIVMLDIDNFKGFNDIYGHDAGDFVLREFTKFVSNNVREEDRLYRLGGDEFVLIFNTSDEADIIEKCNNIREKFHLNTFEFNGKKLPQIGTSWGIKSFKVGDKIDREVLSRDISIDNIKAEVDYYMYAVKYVGLIEEYLISIGKINSKLSEKNGVAYPLFNESGEFELVKIVNSDGVLELTKKELDMISAKKELNKEKIANREI